MIHTDNDGHFRGAETVIEQDHPDFGHFRGVVAPQGISGRMSGVMINSDQHLSIGSARSLAYALLAAADEAENVAIREAAKGPNTHSEQAR